MPHVRREERIGLLGGSFDPAHAGHVAITKAAMTRFRLDRIWWVVSPGNPLKDDAPALMSRRIDAAKDIMRHPRVLITDVEARLDTTYTAETLQKLVFRYPQARFVWLMGADNLAQFDHWHDWRWIMEHVPIGVLARPGQRIFGRMSKAAHIYRRAQISPKAAPILANMPAPAWCFLNVPMSRASSTEIRASGGWIKDA